MGVAADDREVHRSRSVCGPTRRRSDRVSDPTTPHRWQLSRLVGMAENPEVTSDLSAASLQRRSAAAAIDAVPGVIVASALILAKLRRQPTFKPQRSLAVAVQGLSLVGSSCLVADGGATPGQRLLGLRVVDIATGDNLPFRRALVRNAVRSAAFLVRLAIGGRWLHAQRRRQELARERLAGLHSEIRELHEQYADDPDGLSDALGALYREHEVEPWRACLDPEAFIALLYAVALYAPALRSSRHRGLHDRLARAVVIRTN
jgi:hypothetical protein